MTPTTTTLPLLRMWLFTIKAELGPPTLSKKQSMPSGEALAKASCKSTCRQFNHGERSNKIVVSSESSHETQEIIGPSWEIVVQVLLLSTLLSQNTAVSYQNDSFYWLPLGKSQLTTDQCFHFFLRWFCLLSWALTLSHFKCQTFLLEILLGKNNFILIGKNNFMVSLKVSRFFVEN